MMNVRGLGLALFGQDSMRLGYQIVRAQLRRGQGQRLRETNGLELYGEPWFDAGPGIGHIISLLGACHSYHMS